MDHCEGGDHARCRDDRCFAFRATLVRTFQAPLRMLVRKLETLKALGITDSIVISFHLAFYAGIGSFLSATAVFSWQNCFACAHRRGETLFIPAIGVSFALFLLGVMVCYFWLLPKTILFFFVIPSRSAGRQHGRCNSIILS